MEAVGYGVWADGQRFDYRTAATVTAQGRVARGSLTPGLPWNGA